ncbi:MAG TPA: adenylate/guanylate cyclase domain-containing protein [Pyrinomonadaceae bacterium]|nr:adenylate/guanylate cyclase domain-containing protein [Pyrinomonadaceae bacterium]
MTPSQLFNSVTANLFGDPRRFALEHRLFNTISLLNAVANIGGAFAVLSLKNAAFLFVLNFGTGILFLLFYYLSRFRNAFEYLYWPFVLLILGFLFVNTLGNAGSRGGAHYYFIPALVIAIILSGKTSRTIMAIALFCGAALALLVLEEVKPEWITNYANQRERFIDIAGNLLFVQVFMGILVQVLTQNLNQERRKSDRLLRSVLPEAIAQELRQTDRVRPVDYDSASVLFTDFVGFTQIAEGFTPQQLIEELNSCFSEFDRIAKQHKLEKIKTIGDAYMAVGGVPLANRTHAVDCVLAALEIERLISSLREQEMAESRPYWQIRVGVHSGDLVAGVVGREKFSYDVWGDTVNIASRLESSGVAGRINISGATYDLVRDFFDCEFRGKIAAKNKGEIDMYFVNGIRPELSVDGAGRTPNEHFFKLYEYLEKSTSNTHRSLVDSADAQLFATATSQTGATPNLCNSAVPNQ